MKRAVLPLLVAALLILFADPLLVPDLGPDVRPEPRSEPPAPERTDPPQAPAESADEEFEWIEIQVVGPHGKPVRRANVRVWELRSYGRSLSDLEVEDGVGRYRLLFPSIEKLWFEVYGAEEGGPALHGPFEPRPQTIDLRLPAPAAIHGSVMHEDGEPAPGLKVTARPRFTDFRKGFVGGGLIHGRTVTDDDGTFRLEGLGSGAYVVSVEVGRWIPPPEPIEARAGGSPIRLEVLNVSDGTLTALDPDGRPVTGARVGLEMAPAAAGGWRPRTPVIFPSDGSGRIQYLALPRRYVTGITIHPPDSRADLAVTCIPGGLPADGVLRFLPALPIEGTVRDHLGEPVRPAAVWWRRAGTEDPWSPARVTAEGRFRIPSAPVGEIALRVAPPGPDRKVSDLRDHVVRAGREDVVLTLPRTPTLALRIEDWPEHLGAIAYLHLENRIPDEPIRAILSRRTVRFTDLHPEDVGTVVVLGNGTTWLATELRPEDEVQRVTGTSTARITGEVLDAPAGRRITVWIELIPGRFLRARVDTSGEFELLGVPEGTWRVHVATADPGERWEGAADSHAGESVEIRMTRR